MFTQQGSDMNLRAKIKELQHFKQRSREISPCFSYYLLNAIVIAPKTLCRNDTRRILGFFTDNAN